jgi:DNA polymerase-3 subunit chi
MEVSFYHLTSLPLERALPRLVEKIYAAGSKVVMFFEYDEQLKRIDEVLWTYGQMDFLPHGTYLEQYPDQQPVYLTLAPENPNKADILIRIGNKEYPDTQSFKRIVDIFEAKDPLSLQNARDRYKKFKDQGHDLTYWKQDDKGQWEKQG